MVWVTIGVGDELHFEWIKWSLEVTGLLKLWKQKSSSEWRIEISVYWWNYWYSEIEISKVIDNSRTGLDTSKNQCSAPAVTALKNYWRYHVYNLFRLKNSSNVFAFIIIIIGCLTGNIIDDQLKLRPYFLPWVSKNRRYRILKGIDRLSDFIFIIKPRSLKFCRRI